MPYTRSRMYLAQRYLNNIILYTILVDVALGYALKKIQGPQTVLPFAILYLLNIVVILAVYRFWKLPVFEWDRGGFLIYGISPFNKTAGLWSSVEAAGFKEMTVKRGKVREFFVLHFVTAKGLHRTDMLPVYMVGFIDKIKPALQALLDEKGIKPIDEL